jgi:hypothetical protein
MAGPRRVSAHVKCDVPGQAGRAETALGLLITQMSEVQILPRYQAQRLRGLSVRSRFLRFVTEFLVTSAIRTPVT